MTKRFYVGIFTSEKQALELKWELIFSRSFHTHRPWIFNENILLILSSHFHNKDYIHKCNIFTCRSETMILEWLSGRRQILILELKAWAKVGINAKDSSREQDISLKRPSIPSIQIFPCGLYKPNLY